MFVVLCSGSRQLLAPPEFHSFMLKKCVVFFSCAFSFAFTSLIAFIDFFLHVFICSVCFCVVVSVCFVFFSSYPWVCLLLKHRMYIGLLFLFFVAFFSALWFFITRFSCCCFCRLCCLCFAAEQNSTGSVWFYLFLLRFFYVLAYDR